VTAEETFDWLTEALHYEPGQADTAISQARSSGWHQLPRHLVVYRRPGWKVMTLPLSQRDAAELAAPWRDVTAVTGPHEGRGGLLGPATSRRTRWWEMVLSPCGHKVERTVRYRPLENPGARSRGGTQHRSADAVLPAPKRVRCEFCRAAARRSAGAARAR
jgi:hypothetical protein